ncbi:hypothetical protein BDR05DRAFT_955029 [Suillus weaverae]|nr:hypothetical protein BDR05DRAFT_955029 [Suillus weaverae]
MIFDGGCELALRWLVHANQRDAPFWVTLCVTLLYHAILGSMHSAAMGHVEGAQGGFQRIAENVFHQYIAIYRVSTHRELFMTKFMHPDIVY